MLGPGCTSLDEGPNIFTITRVGIARVRSGPVTASRCKKSGFLFIVQGIKMAKTMTLNVTVMAGAGSVHAHLSVLKMLLRTIFSNHLLLWYLPYL